jgi:hypothetical protein
LHQMADKAASTSTHIVRRHRMTNCYAKQHKLCVQQCSLLSHSIAVNRMHDARSHAQGAQRAALP